MYYFEHLRLTVNPQSKVSMNTITDGFINFDECLAFCDSIGFSYVIKRKNKDRSWTTILRID
jgi:hypothetical protein